MLVRRCNEKKLIGQGSYNRPPIKSSQPREPSIMVREMDIRPENTISAPKDIIVSVETFKKGVMMH